MLKDIRRIKGKIRVIKDRERSACINQMQFLRMLQKTKDMLR